MSIVNIADDWLQTWATECCTAAAAGMKASLVNVCYMFAVAAVVAWVIGFGLNSVDVPVK